MAQLMPPDAAALARITVFQDLPPTVLTWLQQAGELRQYAPGETIVLAEEHADRLLAVVTSSSQYYGPGDGQLTHPAYCGRVAALFRPYWS